MGASASSEEVAKKMASLGEEGAYGGVSAAVRRFDLCGSFLVEAPEGEIEDFLLSRCPALDGVQRRRLLFELDCMKRRERKEAEKICAASNSSDERPESLSDDDDRLVLHQKERWRDEGSKYLGVDVERVVWDERGTKRVRARGKIVAWCSAKDSTFLDEHGRKAPLWRASLENVDDVIELEEHEVLAAAAEYEAGLVERAARVVEQSSKRRQRIASVPQPAKRRHDVIVSSAPADKPPPPPPPPDKPEPQQPAKKRGRPRKVVPLAELPPPPDRVVRLPQQTPERRFEEADAVDWDRRKKPRREMLTISEAYEEDEPQPQQQQQQHHHHKPARPRRSLAGRRACRGCHQTPCARSQVQCFYGVETANGKYIAKGDFAARFATPLEAARRYDMLCKDEPRNFDGDDLEQLAFERSFVATSLAPPEGDLDEGEQVTRDGLSWYVCRDEDTLADICTGRNLDLDKILAVNQRCPHFKIGHKLTSKSKLKRFTRVLLAPLL